MVNKIIITLIILIGVTAVFNLYIENIENTAYNKGVQDTQNEYKRQSDILEKEQENKNKIVAKEDFKDSLKSTEIKTEIVYKTEKVIEYVEREITVPATCDKLASDIVLVLHNRTNLINKAVR